MASTRPAFRDAFVNVSSPACSKKSEPLPCRIIGRGSFASIAAAAASEAAVIGSAADAGATNEDKGARTDGPDSKKQKV